jgi:peptide-methionine (S)-S-oxide reductase
MKAIAIFFLLGIALSACSSPASTGARADETKSVNSTADKSMKNDSSPNQQPQTPTSGTDNQDHLEAATFGSGCFWCTEAFFESLKGVKSVVSGYSGGFVKNPAYKEVCSGRTGHAEVTRITFDPAVISYAELLEVFWATHDPTTLNRQGNDSGTQYRSVIFYHNAEQERIALASREAAKESGTWPNPIVTEISPLVNWYPAEDYHQDYFANNPEQPYCAFLIRPKMDKFKKAFAEKLKP